MCSVVGVFFLRFFRYSFAIFRHATIARVFKTLHCALFNQQQRLVANTNVPLKRCMYVIIHRSTETETETHLKRIISDDPFELNSTLNQANSFKSYQLKWKFSINSELVLLFSGVCTFSCKYFLLATICIWNSEIVKAPEWMSNIDCNAFFSFSLSLALVSRQFPAISIFWIFVSNKYFEIHEWYRRDFRIGFSFGVSLICCWFAWKFNYDDSIFGEHFILFVCFRKRRFFCTKCIVCRAQIDHSGVAIHRMGETAQNLREQKKLFTRKKQKKTPTRWKKI